MWVFIKMSDGSFQIGYPIQETEFEKYTEVYVTRQNMQWVFKVHDVKYACFAVNFLNGGDKANSLAGLISSGTITLL